MRISIIGPNTHIPPVGWGAVESLIWDMKMTLEEMGHEIQIINIGDPYQIINMINQFRPDFVHINYDDWIPIYEFIQYPCAITTHFAYIERPELMGGYKERVFNHFSRIKPNVLGLSIGINQIYKDLAGIPDERLYLNPNGVNRKLFEITNNPTYPDRSIYLAKIDHRKRQFLFQDIESIWYAGNIADHRFDVKRNYLGEWTKDDVHKKLTQYGNLILLSDGEAHPLVCLEAFSAGLGVVVSEWGKANLDQTQEFITIIPENKINDIEYIEQKIIENREYCLQNRKSILEYSKYFDWVEILKKYYIPNVEAIINGQK
jgi:hypothetical protein